MAKQNERSDGYIVVYHEIPDGTVIAQVRRGSRYGIQAPATPLEAIRGDRERLRGSKDQEMRYFAAMNARLAALDALDALEVTL